MLQNNTAEKLEKKVANEKKNTRTGRNWRISRIERKREIFFVVSDVSVCGLNVYSCVSWFLYVHGTVEYTKKKMNKNLETHSKTSKMKNKFEWLQEQ